MRLTTLEKLPSILNLVSAEDATTAASEFLSEYVGSQLITGEPLQMHSTVRSTWIVPIQSINSQSGMIQNIGVIAVDEETGRVTGWTPIEQMKDANDQPIVRTDATERANGKHNEEHSKENSLPIDVNRSSMDKNVIAYQALHAQLVVHYLGQYVAIYQGQLVDHDPDPVLLLERIRNRYPDQVVLRRKVENSAEPELYIRHPRIEAAA